VNRSASECNRGVMDDDGLIARVAAGDDGALRELFSRHAPWLAVGAAATVGTCRAHHWGRATCETCGMSVGAPVDHAPIRALLFDLGGVVIELDFKRAFRVWADSSSRDPADIAQRFAFDEAYRQHERGEIGASEYFSALRRSLDLHLSDDEIAQGWNDIYLAPVPGMSALLAAAGRRLPLYAFTNSNPTHRNVWAERFASDLLVFRSIFVSSDLGVRKPDPEAYVSVAGRAGLQVSDFLFFDDTLENVEGARTAGMRSVLVETIVDVRDALSRLGIEVEASDEGDQPRATM